MMLLLQDRLPVSLSAVLRKQSLASQLPMKVCFLLDSDYKTRQLL